MRTIPHIISIVWVFVLACSLCNIAKGQSSSPQSQDSDSQSPDVMILIFPTSSESAKVGLSFHQLVPHEQVKKEISRLSSNGWIIGRDLGIEDRSIRPGAPIVTGAHFSVTNAPQVVNNAPMLRPYVEAFQDWKKVDVLFSLNELKPYNGVDTFESAAVSIKRVAEENVYYYEVKIRDHNAKLPDFIAAHTSESAAPVNGRSLSSSNGKNVPIPLLPLMLILLGGGVLGGLGIYTLLTRRQAGTASARNARL